MSESRKLIGCLALLIVVSVSSCSLWPIRQGADATKGTSSSLCQGPLSADGASHAFESTLMDSTKFAWGGRDDYILFCDLMFDDAGIEIGYTESSYFYGDEITDENELLKFPENYRVSLESRDDGLDGSSYYFSPGPGGGRAAYVWFSDSGRTLSLKAFDREGSDSIPDAELKNRMIRLASYLALALPSAYPTAGAVPSQGSSTPT
ncbi:hypothetical protein [Actinomyces slackii]|uniref:hypothetical protein n=1 Tax=Actinomyces slackii TaxID=52774 RepID=UPI000F83BE2F|nr:hypothetical protein [Actinomyces slackii]